MRDGKQPLARQIIFESDRLRVIWQDAGTDAVFVTFNELGLLKTGDVFWGFELFEKAGISSIGIVTTEPNWYPAEDMRSAIEAINQKTSGHRVITYGHSQGGYGALKFASALKACAVVAFCPQWSIAPDAVGHFDRRYLHFHRDDWHNGLPIKALDMPERSFVFYDPSDHIDAKHVDLLASLGVVERIKVPLSGHETVRIVSEGGISGSFIEILSEAKLPTSGQLRRLVRQARSHSKTYKANLMTALLKKAHLRPGCLDKLEKGGMENSKFVTLCRAVESHDLRKAATLLPTCGDSDILEMGAVNVWSVFRAGKFVEGEKRLAEMFVRIYPRDAFLRLHAVNSFIQAEMYERANTELLCIIADLDVTSHMDHVRAFAKLLANRLEVSEQAEP